MQGVQDYERLFTEVRAAFGRNQLLEDQVVCLYDDTQASLMWTPVDLDRFSPPMTGLLFSSLSPFFPLLVLNVPPPPAHVLAHMCVFAWGCVTVCMAVLWGP